MVIEKLDTSWFDLKNYDVSSDMDLFGWERQLSIRKRHYDLMYQTNPHKLFEPCFKDGEEQIRVVDIHKKLSDYIGSLKTNPIFKNDASSFGNSNPLKRPEPSFNAPSIKSITAMDVWRYGQSLSEFFPELSAKCETNFYEGMRAQYLNRDEWIKNIQRTDVPFDLLLKEQPDYKTYIDAYGVKAIVDIDLRATDEQIKNDFAYWLKEYREATGDQVYNKDAKVLKRTFNDSDCKRWSDDKVLAYLDLTFIAHFYNKEIGSTKIGRLLYPDGHDEVLNPHKKVDRTLRDLANWLMEYSTIKAIKAQLKS